MKYRKLFLIIGLLLLLIVSADMILWIQVWSDTRSYEENLQEWNSYFPEILQNGARITVINILCLGVSIISFWKARQLPGLKIVSTILLIIASMLFLWQVFTLS